MTTRTWTAGELAELVGARCAGPADTVLDGVSTLGAAGPTDLAFCSGGRWLEGLPTTRAGAVVLDAGEVPPGVVALRHDNPRWAFAKLAAAIKPETRPPAFVDSTAVVDVTASIDPTATVDALAVIGAGARIGPRAGIQAHANVGRDSVVGADCRVGPGAVLMERCVLGDRVRLQPGAVVGGDGFGYVAGPDGLSEVPQLGVVVVEPDVHVGVNSTIDRAALGETRVGRGTRLDNLVHIAHGARTGAECLLAAFAGVSGGATLGDHVVLAGRAAVVEHVSVGDGSLLLGMSAATRNVPEGGRLGGAPGRPARQWLREQAAMRGLPEALREIERLRRAVRELERLVGELAQEGAPEAGMEAEP